MLAWVERARCELQRLRSARSRSGALEHEGRCHVRGAVRPAAVAGSWYHGSASALAHEVERHLHRGPEPGDARARQFARDGLAVTAAGRPGGENCAGVDGFTDGLDRARVE